MAPRALLRSPSLGRLGLLALICGAPRVGLAAGEAPARPAEAGTGPQVGRIHLRVGTRAEVRAKGRAFPAAPGLPLLRTDELVVPTGEALVLALHNGYLVRVDEDLTMRVSEIVLLDAPRTREGLGPQLDRLLSKEEQGRAERIAGGDTRRGGGQSVAPQPGSPVLASPQPAERRRSSASPRPAALDGSGPLPASKSAPAPSEEARASGLPSHEAHPRGGSGQLLDSAAASKGTAQRSKAMRPEDVGVPSSAAAPSAPPASLATPAVRRCLAGVFAGPPLRLRQVTLRYKLAGGRVHRIALGGALPAPACAAPLLVGQPAQGTEGPWQRLEIKLR